MRPVSARGRKKPGTKEAGEGRADRVLQVVGEPGTLPLVCRTISLSTSQSRHVKRHHACSTSKILQACFLQSSLACQHALSEVDVCALKRLSCPSQQESTLVTQSQYPEGTETQGAHKGQHSKPTAVQPSRMKRFHPTGLYKQLITSA